MSRTLQRHRVILPQLTMRRLANLCGAFHENIKLVERTLNITVTIEKNSLILIGESAEAIDRAEAVIHRLYPFTELPVSTDKVQSTIDNQESKPTMSSIKLSRKIIQPRNSKQAEYLDSINTKDIVFAVGPAGTGKTWLAVSKAIECFEKGEVQRLVFVRPAVEAGEKLGFLPGDLVEKVLPYLRPVYDAIYEMIGFKEAQKLIQSDVIEILPLAFMRGRTLNEAFIILDEAQNTSVPQMKMFLTRMGFGSKVVVTGDMTQVDLPRDTRSGLEHAISILEHLDKISVHRFTTQEVVRHPLIARIVDCYESSEKKAGKSK